MSLHILLRILRSALHNRRGVSTLEFALVAPVLIVLMMGVFDVGSEIVKNERLMTVAARHGDLITREEALTRGDLGKLLDTVPVLAGDTKFAESGTVIVTAVAGDRYGRRRVSWQQRDDGKLAAESLIGQPGTLANLPQQVRLEQGETIIAVEVFAARRRGMIGALLGGPDAGSCVADPDACMYKTSFYRGRLSDLAVIAAR